LPKGNVHDPHCTLAQRPKAVDHLAADAHCPAATIKVIGHPLSSLREPGVALVQPPSEAVQRNRPPDDTLVLAVPGPPAGAAARRGQRGWRGAAAASAAWRCWSRIRPR
jgi:hypothetical protein